MAEKYLYTEDFFDLFYVASAGQDKTFVKVVEEVVEDTPIAANVVEVVRCKDCEYWQSKNSKDTQGVCLCGDKDMNYGGEFYPFASDFCSYAQKKESQVNNEK